MRTIEILPRTETRLLVRLDHLLIRKDITRIGRCIPRIRLGEILRRIMCPEPRSRVWGSTGEEDTREVNTNGHVSTWIGRDINQHVLLPSSRGILQEVGGNLCNL